MISSKHIFMGTIAAVLLLPLSGCGKKPDDTQAQKVEVKAKLKSLNKALIPDGHWLVNPLYCAKQLPSQGVYDFKISDTKLTMIGIDQTGDWFSLEQASLHDQVLSFLATDKANCLDISTDSLTYATFNAPGTHLTMAYIAGTDKLFIIKGYETHLATRFDMDILKYFEFVEIEQPDDIDSTEEFSSNTNQLIEVVYEDD